MNLARMRKALVVAVAFLAVLATQLPPDTPEALQRWAPVVILAATLLGVYRVPNRQPPPELPPAPGVAGPGTSKVGQVESPQHRPEGR